VIRVIRQQHSHHKTLFNAHLGSTLHDHLFAAAEKRHSPGKQHSRHQTVADCSPRPEISAPPELPKPHTFKTVCHAKSISLAPAKRLRPRSVKTLFQRPQR
jgi:hypothetical protein